MLLKIPAKVKKTTIFFVLTARENSKGNSSKASTIFVIQRYIILKQISIFSAHPLWPYSICFIHIRFRLKLHLAMNLSRDYENDKFVGYNLSSIEYKILIQATLPLSAIIISIKFVIPDFETVKYAADKP